MGGGGGEGGGASNINAEINTTHINTIHVP